MRRRQRGVTMVEMALLLPILLLFTLGIVEFGWYVYHYSALEHAARRGSEQAAKEPPSPSNTGKPSDGCVTEIRRQAKLNLMLIDLKDQDITVNYVGGAKRALGNQIEVRVRHTAPFLTPAMHVFKARHFQLDFRSRRSIVDTMVFQEPARCP